jgi:hypothetical protein
MEVGGQFHASAALTQVPIGQEIGCFQNWSGGFREGKQLLPLQRIKPQFLNHSTHSLYAGLEFIRIAYDLVYNTLCQFQYG